MSQASTSRSIPWHWGLLALGLALLLIVFPPVRIVRLGAGGKSADEQSASAQTFEPAAFARTFWTERLQPAAAGASALAPVLLAVQADPSTAATRHGRKVGEGSTYYYFVRGSGRVTAIEKNQILLEVEGAPGLSVALRTGPVFGNSLRDGSGLLDLNGVPGLAEFNALSGELNRLVERLVQPVLKTKVAVGARLAFAGCAEAPDSVGSGPLLRIVPVQAEVLP